MRQIANRLAFRSVPDYLRAMRITGFEHVRTWVFDLDHTLYPPSMRLFDQIEEKMTAYMIRETGLARDQATVLRKRYWADYGTTLAGLMQHHDVDADHYLAEVHDIDFTVIAPAPDLAEAIRALPGRRIVYTNGSAPYARAVLQARGLHDLFEAVYGVENAGYVPKPRREAFAAVFDQSQIDPTRAAMFEDDPRNLVVPHDLGMRTVHVAPDSVPAPHIHHHTDDLTGFLGAL